MNYPTLLDHGSTVRFVESGAFAWTPVLATVGGRLVIAILVNVPRFKRTSTGAPPPLRGAKIWLETNLSEHFQRYKRDQP